MRVVQRGPGRALFADAVAVAVAPSRHYAAMLDAQPHVPWTQMLRRPLLVLLIIAISVSIAGTGRVTVSLIATAMLTWSFAIAIQLAAAVAIIATAAARRVDVPTAIDLLFAGHLPWSVWLLLAAVATVVEAPRTVIAATVVIPLAWTAVVLAAFCGVVLASSNRDAAIRVLAHQALIGIVTANYIVWNAGGWGRFAF
jgi:hypothetical protein